MTSMFKQRVFVEVNTLSHHHAYALKHTTRKEGIVEQYGIIYETSFEHRCRLRSLEYLWFNASESF